MRSKYFRISIAALLLACGVVGPVGGWTAGASTPPPRTADAGAGRYDALAHNIESDAGQVESYVRSNGLESIFGGFYLDHANGDHEVALFCKDEAEHSQRLRSRMSRAQSFDVMTCKYSKDELDEILARLSSPSSDLVGKGLIADVAFVDIPQNRVVVSLANYSSQSVGALNALAGAAVVPVPPTPVSPRYNGALPASRTNDPRPLLAGDDADMALGECTLGFTVYNNVEGTGMLSAGHCALQNEPVINGGEVVGTTLHSTQSQDGDVSFSRINPVATGPGAVAAVWTNYPIGGPGHSEYVAGTDAGHEQRGYTRCFSSVSAQTLSSGTFCGELLATNVTIFNQGVPYFLHMRMMGHASVDGDSGAPVWHPLDNDAYAAGILCCGSADPDSTLQAPQAYIGEVSYYTHIDAALAMMGVNLG